MKFYSDKLDQLFDTVEELEAAEAVKRKRKVKSVEETVTAPTTPSRKDMAAAIEQAEENLKAAYADYETAKAKVEEISKKYLEEVNSILDPAKATIQKAEQEKYEAIRKFNEVFGAYQVTYTGSRAAEEMIKAMSNIDNRFNRLFRDVFRF